LPISFIYPDTKDFSAAKNLLALASKKSGKFKLNFENFHLLFKDTSFGRILRLLKYQQKKILKNIFLGFPFLKGMLHFS